MHITNTTRKLAIGGTTFCGAPNSHAPQKTFLWRIVLHAPQILWRTKTEFATEICLSVAHMQHAPQSYMCHKKSCFCGACWMCATEMWLSVAHVAYAPQKFEKLKKIQKIQKKLKISTKNQKIKKNSKKTYFSKKYFL